MVFELYTSYVLAIQISNISVYFYPSAICLLSTLLETEAEFSACRALHYKSLAEGSNSGSLETSLYEKRDIQTKQGIWTHKFTEQNHTEP